MDEVKKDIKLWGVISLVVVIFFFISTYYMFRSSPLLELVEKNILDNRTTVRILLCNRPIEKIEDFIGDLKSRSQTKISGSNPARFFELKIEAGNTLYRLFVGQDSRNAKLFWIYPFEKPLIKTPITYIQTNSFSENIESICSETKNAWVNKYGSSEKSVGKSIAKI